MSNTPILPERLRTHEAPHIRSIEMQMLDAMLRVEEMLQKLVDAGLGTRIHDEFQINADVKVEDVIEQITPKETPLSKAIAKGRKVTRL
jgi:hypothetical protein